MASSSSGSAAHANHYVDYVIRYSFSGNGNGNSSENSKATDQLELLLRKLADVGLQTEVRQGDESSLLIFVRASKKSLKRAVHQSRVRDWLYGVRNTEPEPADAVEAQTESERLRVINHMIIVPQEEGGAGITPKHGEWKNVLAIFPLHDVEGNRRRMNEWNKKTFLSSEDLEHIRSNFGESVGFYFAFLRAYFRFLAIPSAFGFSCWLLLGSFSITYTVCIALWSVVFIEYWKSQEVDLSCRWQTMGVSVVRPKRREFKPEREERDEGTGEVIGVFPARKRFMRQLLQVPFVFLSSVALGAIIATCFAIEIFISEVYNGPLKTYLVFIPTVLVSSLVPTMSAVLVSIATQLNDYENYETNHSYGMALTQKIFVINFVTSYLPVFLTAFVYVPFASRIVPYLDVFRLTVRPFVSKEAVSARREFSIDPDRLRKQVIYFTVTAQIVGFAMETIVPFLKQYLLRKYKEHYKEKSKAGPANPADEKEPPVSFDDPPEEVKFLTRVRNEADLSEYDVTDDLRQMCIQFGYLALFSPTWPLVPVSFLINNWVQLRSDLFKICMECRRPTPQRADTIGPWLDSLGFLSWVGSITSSALLYMFSNGRGPPNGEPSAIHGGALLLTIFFAEHIYLIVRYAIRAFIAKLEPPNAKRERTERFLMRKRYLDSTIRTQSDDDEAPEEASAAIPDISRESLEDDARATTMHDVDPAERFWSRQKGYTESAKVGAGIIRNQLANANKKNQ